MQLSGHPKIIIATFIKELIYIAAVGLVLKNTSSLGNFHFDRNFVTIYLLLGKPVNIAFIARVLSVKNTYSSQYPEVSSIQN